MNDKLLDKTTRNNTTKYKKYKIRDVNTNKCKNNSKNCNKIKNENPNERNTIILDHENNICRYGFAGYNHPCGAIEPCVFYNLDTKKYLIPPYVYGHGNIKCINPIINGIICSIQHMKRIWNNIFYKKMCINPDEYNIVLSVMYSCDPEYSITLTKIMLYHYRFKNVMVVDRFMLSLYSCGQLTGLVVYVTNDLIKIMPICENYIIYNAVKYIHISSTSHHWIDTAINHILQSISDSPIDIRLRLFENVTIMGEHQFLHILYDKICDKSLLKHKINISMINNEACWLGGSIIAMIKSFDKYWLNAECDLGTI